MNALGIGAMFVVAALAGAGCAADPDGTTAQTRGWFAARALDLSDVVAVRVAVGPGLLAHARVTRFVAIGAGELGSVAAGRPSFTLDHYQLGWIKREGGLWTERRVELGLSTMYSFDAEGETLAGDRVTFGPPSRHTFDVGADVHLALIGLAVDVRIDEALDFIGGLFGADLLDDDALPSTSQDDVLRRASPEPSRMP
jgi:hypothetical protein